jgi:hypothetical protein
MYEWLYEIPADDFVLDETALNNFFTDFGIDTETFTEQDLWETIKTEELGIVYMPYDVNYIREALWYAGFDASEVSSTAMYDFLIEVDWDNFVLDEFAIEEFLEAFEIDSDTFHPAEWETVKTEWFGIVYLPYEVN